MKKDMEEFKKYIDEVGTKITRLEKIIGYPEEILKLKVTSFGLNSGHITGLKKEHIGKNVLVIIKKEKEEETEEE